MVATVAVMADARDLQKSIGNGDGAWFATADSKGRGTLRGIEDRDVLDDEDANHRLTHANGELIEVRQFVPTIYLYDNFPGGVGLSEPLWNRQTELVQRATELVERCDCKAGCPACVGPVLAADEGNDGATPRSLALRVLGLLDRESTDR